MSIELIAEIGCNWHGLRDAARMIKAAKAAHADFVKFQLFGEQEIADIKEVNKALYKKLTKKVLTEKAVKTLKKGADRKKIGFILTPMSLEAVDIADKYADEYIKVRFKDHENSELINKILDTGKTALISVPARPVADMTRYYNPRVKFLYCLPDYPPKIEDFCLEFATTCEGVSSHFPHTVCDLAFAINRLYEHAFIEKHVMFSHYNSFFLPIDFKVSITFEQLAEFKKQLRLISQIRRLNRI